MQCVKIFYQISSNVESQAVRGVEAGVVGAKSSLIVEAINFEGKPCKGGSIRLLEGEIVSELTGARASCSVEGSYINGTESVYKISYHPTIKGRHQLHITVEGQHVSGSPFCVAVKSPIKELGIPIATIHEVGKPWGCAINQSREVFVTDENAHCVAVFAPGGQKLRSFGTRGSSLRQFNSPAS